MADLPGLIEGASQGKGLGHQFLRHIERTRVLVVLLDCSSEDLEDDYRTLMAELETYGEGLNEKPRVVALSKADLLPDAEVPRGIFGGEHVMFISAHTGRGLDELGHAVIAMLKKLED
jgi:GTP-binding protein